MEAGRIYNSPAIFPQVFVPLGFIPYDNLGTILNNVACHDTSNSYTRHLKVVSTLWHAYTLSLPRSYQSLATGCRLLKKIRQVLTF